MLTPTHRHPARHRAQLTAADSLADGGDEAAEQYAASLERAEALDAWDARRPVQIALEALGAETDMTRLLSDLSVGQRYRVRLACLLGAEDDFLLLDEPTDHLSIAVVDELTEALWATRASVVLSTHDRQLLRGVADWPQVHLMAMAEGEVLA